MSRTITSTRLAERKRAERRRGFMRAMVAGIAICLLLFGLGLLSRISPLLVTSVSVTGAEVVDTDRIEHVVWRELAGDYLLLFTKQNVLLYPQQAIEQELKSIFPRIKTVDVSRTGQTVTVTVTEYSGEYLWCGNVLPSKQVSIKDLACYFVDQRGYIFDRAPYFSGSVYFKFYGGVEDPDDPIGSYVVSEAAFDELVRFKDFLPSIGITSATFFVPDDGDYELYLKSLDTPGIVPKLIFSSQDSFDTILNNFNTILHAEPFQSKFTESFDTLEYVDLRFGDQVFYKFSD